MNLDQKLFFIVEMDIVRAIYYYILSIAAVLSIFNRPKDRSILLLQIYIISIFIIEVSALVAIYLGGYNNVWIYNLWVIIQFPFLTKIIFSQFKSKHKYLEKLCLVVFTTLPVCNFLFWQGINTLNTLTMQIGAVYMVILVLFYFRSLLDTPEKSIIRNPYFYIGTALLIFYVGTVLYYTFLNFFIKSDLITYTQISYILLLINWVTYSLFILAILFDSNNKRNEYLLKSG